MTNRLEENTTIYHGDCLKIMQSMPDESVDCIISDPPYAGFDFDGESVENYWKVFVSYYNEMLRVCQKEKRLAISQPAIRHTYFSTVFPFTRVLSIADGFANNRGVPADFLLTNPKTEEPQSAENWPEDIVPKSIHPNDRDINKMAIIVKTMTREGDTVLDPFCGSGAIGIACVLLGRKYIGIELDKERAEDARKRLEATLERCPRNPEMESGQGKNC
ncbi:MAG: site-specific DNA-methyltransferase [Gammaproteobacteria bacterium]|nr:site-specific DNA-methyltransferase [Gammaproteobacteria bacterium]MCK5092698.1 site-specific DNA-methyltransferase [Gammaproteobacteria bacterium]